MTKDKVHKLLNKLRTDYVTLDALNVSEIKNGTSNLSKEEISLLIYLLETLHDNYYTIKQCFID